MWEKVIIGNRGFFVATAWSLLRWTIFLVTKGGRVLTIKLALRQLMLVAVSDAFNYQIFLMKNCSWVLEVDIIGSLNNAGRIKLGMLREYTVYVLNCYAVSFLPKAGTWEKAT